jgi:hypothetical protein
MFRHSVATRAHRVKLADEQPRLREAALAA